MFFSSAGKNGRRLSIYDLEKQQSIVELDPYAIPGKIHKIACSTGAFAVTYLNGCYDEFQTLLFTWDGAEAVRIQTLAQYTPKPKSRKLPPELSRSGIFGNANELNRRLLQHANKNFDRYTPTPDQLKVAPQLSRSGILAYRPDAKQRVCLHHAHKDIDLGQVEVNFDFDDIRINPEGSLVALCSSSDGQCVVYQTEAKEKLLEFKVHGIGRQKASTDDFRVLLYEGSDGDGLTIVHLLDSIDENGISSISTFSLDIKSCSVAIFRIIHGVQHLQLVESGSGILRLYKYKGNYEWILL